MGFVIQFKTKLVKMSIGHVWLVDVSDGVFSTVVVRPHTIIYFYTNSSEGIGIAKTGTSDS